MKKIKAYCCFILVGLALNWGCNKADTATPSNVPQLFVPTAFTPNGDGINDVFLVVASAPVTYYSITIYDNSNIVVYKGNDINTGWDGKYEGEPETVGGYFWVINYQAEGSKVAKMSGWVELIR